MYERRQDRGRRHSSDIGFDGRAHQFRSVGARWCGRRHLQHTQLLSSTTLNRGRLVLSLRRSRSGCGFVAFEAVRDGTLIGRLLLSERHRMVYVVSTLEQLIADLVLL